MLNNHLLAEPCWLLAVQGLLLAVHRQLPAVTLRLLAQADEILAEQKFYPFLEMKYNENAKKELVMVHIMTNSSIYILIGCNPLF